MPVKMRKVKARARRITPEAVAAWRRAVQCQAPHDECAAAEHFEGYEDAGPEHPRRYVRRHLPGCEEYEAARRELHRELALRPWECSPLDAGDGPVPAGGALWQDSWPLAQELRRELEAEAKGR